MSLTSLYYLLFLGIVIFLYYNVRHSWRVYLLLISSFVFYYSNQGWYVVFLTSSILLNYQLCLRWTKRKRKRYIYAAIIYNILVLSLFKYLPRIMFGADIPESSIWNRLVLPIGISFFSFQAIGYTLDLYWGGHAKRSSFPDFSLYMSFFPQLLSGPIARSKQFIPQIDKYKRFEYDNIVAGGRLILWGLFKKLVIANNLSPYTDAVFNNIPMHKGFTFVIAILAYAIQVYTDFSGYSDIAIGSARALGFTLLENFRMPYFAQSVTEFWRRWHISLSSWVRDYVNTPLQYKLRGLRYTGVMIAAYVTFLIIGIWHGASWNFVLFGLIQGSAITYELLSQTFRSKLWARIPNRIGGVLSNLLVFGFFSLCAVLLRVSVSDAITILSRISIRPVGVFLGSKQLLIYSAIGIVIVWLVEYALKDGLFSDFLARRKLIFRWSYYVACITLIALIGSLNNENFIYFQF